MQAKQLAFFVLALSLAGGIINSSGIFDTDFTTYEVDVDEGIADDIIEIDDSVQSKNDLTEALDGWKMLKRSWDTMKTVFSVLALPGKWLLDLGVGAATAIAVQIMVSVVEVWGLIQLLTGRSTKGME